MNKIRLFSIAILMLLFSASASNAVVELVENGVKLNVVNAPGISQINFLTAAGEPGNFEILICATRSDGTNSFLNATPGWTTIDNGECGGGGSCILGIFTRTDESADESPNTCRWADPTNMAAAGTFRYRGVDPDDFFINVQCNTGNGGFPTAPSILTSAGSGVVRTFTTGGFFNQPLVDSKQVQEGSFGYGASADGEFISGRSISFAFEDFEPTGEFTFEFTEAGWRACTIAFGPKPDIGTVPTLSEWGLGVFATLFGIAAVWALWRRAARAR